MGASISFQGKHVLITGGSEGIGFALAQCFRRAGASVTILGRSQGKLDDARDDLLVCRNAFCVPGRGGLRPGVGCCSEHAWASTCTGACVMHAGVTFTFEFDLIFNSERELNSASVVSKGT